MIQLHITMTGKGYHPSSKWAMFADDTRTFPSIDAAKAWLKGKYGSCKRVPMYRDTEEGVIKTGYIYSFRAENLDYRGNDKWLQQDWVEFREIIPVVLGRGV